jgi:low temperature requirement protein LtrA
MGASFHYVHAVLVGGVIVAAVGHDLVMAHPSRCRRGAGRRGGGRADPLPAGLRALQAHRHPGLAHSHLVGALALLGVALASGQMSLLTLGALVAAILLAVSVWERWACAAALAPSHEALH